MSISDAQAVVAADVEPDFVARIAAGDRKAELEFVRRYAHGISVLLRRRCRPGDPIVEDLTQDVLMCVLQRLRSGGIRDSAALPAYIQTTVVYTATAEYRRRRAAEPLSAIENMPSDENPIERISTSQRSNILKTLLAEMPVERDREILVRFYLAEEAKEAVCRELGIADAHFHRVIFRARERFRHLLDHSGFAEV
ncbi:sigma-70 family RNA polymerase sigma factor [Pseudolysobacter antarcticus]|uniref:Sigma-70 family RNA polymerase sigma factor n=1 Tax=Pseudolysobacter antarcticus TaxID=2511995 RepID=A0A411HLJ2_9GAMM|nr:sigma-70 family RNA polymerase sigma factor [Pseudolysobacter antarcticus]QBB71270.1 sigma-70 family RNA polymerase sigma factor [Pseudolysobacter antarcticus]